MSAKMSLHALCRWTRPSPFFLHTASNQKTRARKIKNSIFAQAGRWSVSNIVHFQLCTQQIRLDYRDVCRHTQRGDRGQAESPLALLALQFVNFGTELQPLWEIGVTGSFGYAHLDRRTKSPTVFGLWLATSNCVIVTKVNFVCAEIFTHPLYMSMWLKSVHSALVCRQISFIHACSKRSLIS